MQRALAGEMADDFALLHWAETTRSFSMIQAMVRMLRGNKANRAREQIT